MRIRSGVFLAILALLQGISARRAAAQGTEPEPTRRSLEALYQRFLDGLRLRDTTHYRDLLTADYIFVGGDSSRVITGRTARFAFDQSSRDVWEEFAVERCELVIRPSVAVGPCWYRARGKSDGQAGDWRGVSLTTFVREAGRWKIAATRPSVLRDQP